jgi:mono/diheme cytochrome c family protein
MRPLFAGLAALAVVSITSSSLVLDACGQESKARPKAAPQPATVRFSEDIFPIFKGRCLDCHQPGGQGYEKSGLDLTSYEGLMKGTKFGPMVIPKDPGSSNLLWLLDWRASPELRMPHGTKKLSTCDRDAIRRWIWEGAQKN